MVNTYITLSRYIYVIQILMNDNLYNDAEIMCILNCCEKYMVSFFIEQHHVSTNYMQDVQLNLKKDSVYRILNHLSD